MVKASKVISEDETDLDWACLQVGRFFHTWSLLESQINDLIRKIFKLSAINAAIICANIQFRDKVFVIQTAMAFQSRHRNEESQRKIRKIANRIFRLSKSRNLLAHTGFAPTKGRLVCLYKIEAKGNFDVPDVFWTESDFECKRNSMLQVMDDLSELGANLESKGSFLAKLLMEQPSQSSGALGLLSPQNLPQEAPLGSQQEPSNPKTNPQSDPDHPPKKGAE